MNTINSISANVPCTQKTGVQDNDCFSDKVHMTTTTKMVKVQLIVL